MNGRLRADGPAPHNIHLCLGCGGTITPEQPEISVQGAGRNKGMTRFRHADDGDCGRVLAVIGTRAWPSQECDVCGPEDDCPHL